MEADYKLIDNEERHQYEFHVDQYTPNIRLVPLCPFVAGYIHKHPEWKRIVMKGIHIQ